MKNLLWQVLLLTTLTAPIATASNVSPADESAADDICTGPYDGPFAIGKYPVAHLVYLNTATGCFKRWRVGSDSPYDVRCAFFEFFSGVNPTSLPQDSLMLSTEQLAAYVEMLGMVDPDGSGQVNSTMADPSTGSYKYAGFKRDLTPTGTPAECR